MLDLRGYKGFALRVGDLSTEAGWITYHCLINNITLKRIPEQQPFPDDLVPSGSVEWCSKILGYPIIPNYYPNWLSSYLHRRVWRSDEWIKGVHFVKPADRYKRFNGYVTTSRKKKKPPFWYSDVFHFQEEFRYYVSNGKVICGEWYDGMDNLPKIAPTLNIDIPSGYCGALDFGEDTWGNLVLVEAQHPFACGWYGPGKDIEKYMQWLVDGWLYMEWSGI
jgi:hypothetical protein